MDVISAFGFRQIVGGLKFFEIEAQVHSVAPLLIFFAFL